MDIAPWSMYGFQKHSTYRHWEEIYVLYWQIIGIPRAWSVTSELGLLSDLACFLVEKLINGLRSYRAFVIYVRVLSTFLLVVVSVLFLVFALCQKWLLMLTYIVCLFRDEMRGKEQKLQHTFPCFFLIFLFDFDWVTFLGLSGYIEVIEIMSRVKPLTKSISNIKQMAKMTNKTHFLSINKTLPEEKMLTK